MKRYAVFGYAIFAMLLAGLCWPGMWAGMPNGTYFTGMISDPSPQGINMIAGGNAPGFLRLAFDPERVAQVFDPFRVDLFYMLTGGVAPGYYLQPFQGSSAVDPPA